MKKTLTFLSILTISISLIGQSCLPGDNLFTTQADIDNFYINNPTCTTIEGNLMIMGDDITNLSGLQNITAFQGGLWIESCPIEDFSGLENVTYIGDYLEIGGLLLIEGFDELINLTYVGGALDIIYCPALTNLSGLENIESSPTHIIFWGNTLLNNLDGLNNLHSVSTTLKLQNNNSLSDISALANISLSELSFLTIKDNLELSVCDINSICSALNNGITAFDVENNGNGCKTISEIENACATSIAELNSNLIGFYPNPSNSEITFAQSQNKKIKIFNSVGQVVLMQENVTSILNISELLAGVYFIRIEYSDKIIENKLIIN